MRQRLRHISRNRATGRDSSTHACRLGHSERDSRSSRPRSCGSPCRIRRHCVGRLDQDGKLFCEPRWRMGELVERLAVRHASDSDSTMEKRRMEQSPDKLDLPSRCATCGVSPSTSTARSGKGRRSFPVRPSWSRTLRARGIRGRLRVELLAHRARTVLSQSARRAGHPGRARPRSSRRSIWPASEVQRRMGSVPVLVIGTDELAEVLASSGHTPSRSTGGRRPRRSSSGSTSTSTTSGSAQPPRAVAAGASFFAVNLDSRFPVGPGAFDPGCGALAAGDRRGGRRAEPVAIGKPEPHALPCRHRTARVPRPPGGHGRRQPVVRHRRRPRRRDVHDLARSRK